MVEVAVPAVTERLGSRNLAGPMLALSLPVPLGAGMVAAGFGIAPSIACLYLLVDRVARRHGHRGVHLGDEGSSGPLAGIASGNALGDTVVERAGTDRSS